VNNFVREMILAEFKEEFSKLFDSPETSFGDVLKALLKLIQNFMEGGFKKTVIDIGQVVAEGIAWLFPLPDYVVDKETGVLCIPEYEFNNFGETVQNTPSKTFFPKTLKEVQDLVKYAKNKGKRLRVAGMRHSWSSLFSDTNELLLCLLPLAVTDTISYARSGDLSIIQQIQNWGSEFSSIEVIEDLGDIAHIKVGAATTTKEMLEWSTKSGWTLPLDVIATMITYGGSNAPICHGAGLKHKTLSDLVIKLEFVNANGELQTVEDKERLATVSGSFGLAGIVTNITFKMDKMTYAKFQPLSKKNTPGFNMKDSIPPPGTDRNDTAFKRMVELCEKSYYAEFFWYPNQGSEPLEEGYWQNCWKNDGDEKDATTLTSPVDAEYQVARTFLFAWVTKILKPLTLLPPFDDGSKPGWLRYLYTKAISGASESGLPTPEDPITTPINEALYFTRGLHYFIVRDFEIEIPVPSLPDGSADWSILSRAWWDAVDLIQKSAEEGLYACDVSLECRVMAGSDVLMAPQFGNKHGTVSIEVVSTEIVPTKIWEDFKVKLAKVWMSYTDHDGTPLLARFHWAKDVPREVTIQGDTLPTVAYDHRVYAKNMEEFFKTLSNLTENVTIGDISKLFSNKWMDSLFKPEWDRYPPA